MAGNETFNHSWNTAKLSSNALRTGALWQQLEWYQKKPRIFGVFYSFIGRCAGNMQRVLRTIEPALVSYLNGGGGDHLLPLHITLIHMSLVFLFAMKNLSDQALTNLCQGLRDTANLWREISAVNGNYCVRTDVTLQTLATHNQIIRVKVSVSLSLRFQNTFPKGRATLSSHTDTNSLRSYQQFSRFGSPWILIGNEILTPE